MLVAWALSLLNPAPLRLRRLGYVRQSGLSTPGPAAAAPPGRRIWIRLEA